MKIKTLSQVFALCSLMAVTYSCSEVAKANDNTATTTKTEEPADEKAGMLKVYPEVPREEMMKDPVVWAEMKERYKNNIAELNSKIEATGAKLIVAYITPEIGNSTTPAQREGKPFIESICTEIGAEFVDLTANLKDKDPKEVTNMPIDGHWSKTGAKIIATDLEPVLAKYDAQKATATYTQRPALFGDLKANQDEVLDGGKNLPYRLQTNSQGLRMDFDLAFPKTKQRVLFMGDSGFFFPFMDNKDIVNALLQAKYTNKEFVNSCNWGYGIDDQVSLFDERVKYTEPDVVILQTSGTDIMDMYFSHRNRFGRTKKAFQPSAAEKAFYEATFKK